MSRKSRKYILLIIILFLLLPGLLAGNSPSPEQPKMDEQTYRNNMRRLWEDQGTWTHLFIISTLNDLQYREPTVNRLLENQHNIGEAIEPFYGDEASEQLVGLLERHVLITDEMLHAAKNADAATFEDTVTSWYANADQIAEFLHECKSSSLATQRDKSNVKRVS